MQVSTNKLKPNSTQLYLIARALDGDIKDFFKDPANALAFEERKSKKEVKGVRNGTVIHMQRDC